MSNTSAGARPQERVQKNRLESTEWVTLIFIFACYGAWGLVTIYAAKQPLVFLPILAIITAFHTSLQHEVLHGHPTRYPWLNEALVAFPLVLVLPFRRYRDLHLKHHEDVHLTDPYEDPESYFWPSADVNKMSNFTRALYYFNNTFVGRMIIGPGLMMIGFGRTEFKRLLANDSGIRLAWALHAAGLLLVVFWLVEVAQLSLLLYFLFVAYPALALISVRSYAEHKAEETVGGRTAVVETNLFWSTLFLNNNLHIVHHAHPGMAWYKLPKLYAERKKEYLTANNNYLFKGYGEVVKRYGLTARQPLAHPLWHRDDGVVVSTVSAEKPAR